MDIGDLEKGEASGPRFQHASPEVSTGSSNGAEYRGKALPKDDLEVFQTLLGIHFLVKGGGLNPDKSLQIQPASPMADIFLPTRTSSNRWRNRGLYDRALSQDLKMRVLYSLSHYIIFGLYILQILVAATLTGISAYGEPDAPLTVLGAINTVIAGLLAWLTGQGMPVRFRRARDQNRRVVKAIEAAERTFAEIDYIDWAEGERPHPVRERDRLEQMFTEACLDEESNYPETHHSPAADESGRRTEYLQENLDRLKNSEETFKRELQVAREELVKIKAAATVHGLEVEEM